MDKKIESLIKIIKASNASFGCSVQSVIGIKDSSDMCVGIDCGKCAFNFKTESQEVIATIDRHSLIYPETNKNNST
jgi:transcription elongation factor Elf1